VRVRKSIPISNIIMDRYPFKRVLDLVVFLSNGGVVPPIKLTLREDGTYKIRDGRHRVMAYKLLGRREIDSVFYRKRRERQSHD